MSVLLTLYVRQVPSNYVTCITPIIVSWGLALMLIRDGLVVED